MCSRKINLLYLMKIFQKLKDSNQHGLLILKNTDGYYYTSIGFKELINKASTAQLHENNNKRIIMVLGGFKFWN